MYGSVSDHLPSVLLLMAGFIACFAYVARGSRRESVSPRPPGVAPDSRRDRSGSSMPLVRRGGASLQPHTRQKPTRASHSSFGGGRG